MKINKHIAISESGFVFNPSTGESFNVNPLGVDILNALKQDLEYDDLVQQMTEKYDVAQDTFEKDYQDFIYMLSQYNLILND